MVNEAWNELVENANGEIVAILNDDIEIYEGVWETVAKLEEGEIMCPYFSRKTEKNKIYSDNGNNIVGFFFALHKKDYPKIPSSLGLWYGDNYVYQKLGKMIRWGGFIHHWESRTLLSPERKDYCDKIIENDKLEWAKISNENDWK